MLSALTAWEDGGSAVLQAETARRGLATCGGWRSHANDRTTTYCPPTPLSPATTMFVLGTAVCAGEGGRQPKAVPDALEPRAASGARSTLPGASLQGSFSQPRSKGWVTPPNVTRPCRGRSPSSGGEGIHTLCGTKPARVASIAMGSRNAPGTPCAKRPRSKPGEWLSSKPGERPSVSWLVKPCRARTTRERYFFRGGAHQFCLANIKDPPRVRPAGVPAPLPPSG